MNQVQKELEAAWKLLVNIQVAGDAVEWMAAAKASLRRAYQMAAEPTQEKGGAEHEPARDVLC